MNVSRKPMVVAMAIFAASAADASDVSAVDEQMISETERFSVSLFTGVLHNASQERVFEDDGQRLSQLEWRTRVAPILGASFTFQANDRLALNTTAWARVTSGGTRMKDLDWAGRDDGISEWTDRSIHPKTELTQAYGIDSRASYRVVMSDAWAVDVLAGYRFKKLRWNGKGGSFIYSSATSIPGESGFRDLAGAFDGDVIRYSQWWQTGYVGIRTRYDLGRLTVEGEATGSLWARGRDKDYHIERDYLSRTRGVNSSMIGLSVKASYAVSHQWSLFARAEYEKYFEVKAMGQGVQQGEYLAGKAGLANRSLLFNVGAEYRF